MNFHQHSVQARMLDPIRQNHHLGGKDEKELYESMFAKQFQIIQTFLEKINELYNKNEDFEHTICQLEDKMERIETSTKNIHYQFRTTHLMIDKKLNTMNTDYNNMQEQLKTFQLQRPIEKYLSSKHFLRKSSHLKTRKNKRQKVRNKMKSSQGEYKISVLSNNDLNMTTPGILQKRDDSKDSEPKSQISCDKSNHSKLSNRVVAFKDADNNNSLIQQSDGINSMTSLNSSVNISPSIKMLEDRDGFESEEYSEQTSIDHQFIQNAIENKTKQISLKFQEEFKKVRKIHQQSSISFQNNLTALQQKQQKMITQVDLDNLSSKLLQQLEAMITAVKEQFSVSLVNIKHEIFEYNQNLIATFEENDKRLITQKVEMSYFEQSMDNLTAAINDQMVKWEKNFANKIQTKRAIEFLDTKMSRIINEEYSNFKSKKNVGMQDQYLKINKCESSKKVDLFSQKSIKDRLQDSQMRSLETSMQMIEPQKACSPKGMQNKVKRVISQLITWKNHTLNASLHAESAQKQFKLLRSKSRQSHDPTIQFKRLSKNQAEPNINLKEWREKVIKVLKKEDRRKRKVTFR